MSALGCFPTAETLAMFEEGFKLIVDRWTALQLAVDNQMGGTNTGVMVSTLQIHTRDFFKQYGNQVEVDELEGNLQGYFEECFNIDLQDGSASQVARVTVQLYRELASQGRSDALDRLRSTMKNARAVTGSKAMAADSDYEDDDSDEDDGSDDDDAMQEDSGPSVQAPPPPPPIEKIVDEDGFELVQTRRRRK
ncbi:hypothetical protein HDU97_000864 [Phlyctochytrium planicorne]|nr:hypothetical protein HDU97_000864 [Phlyctochytrium planicorne]